MDKRPRQTLDDLLEMMIPDDWRRRVSALSNE